LKRLSPEGVKCHCLKLALPPVKVYVDAHLADHGYPIWPPIPDPSVCLPKELEKSRGFGFSSPKTQEAKNRPNIPSQEKFHRGVLRGLRNISETP
jgi:hypothetical protein